MNKQNNVTDSNDHYEAIKNLRSEIKEYIIGLSKIVDGEISIDDAKTSLTYFRTKLDKIKAPVASISEISQIIYDDTIKLLNAIHEMTDICMDINNITKVINTLRNIGD